MTLKDIMTDPVIRIHPGESVAVAARTLERYNIGALPVCSSDGSVCGILTDRDIVTRCLAAGRKAETTTAGAVMTAQVTFGEPNMSVERAAEIMAERQIRRMPVLENGRICGMVSLGDLATHGETNEQAGDVLSNVSKYLSSRK